LIAWRQKGTSRHASAILRLNVVDVLSDSFA
jgi:hypothetical protein